MKVQSANNQSHEISQAQTARSNGPDTEPITAPSVFDTSGYRPSVDGRAGEVPHANGVAWDNQGQRFIKQGAQTYPVKYDKDNGTWRVVNPENPAKYQYPVKQDENGAWHTHSDVGLQGGSRGQRLQTLLNDAKRNLEQSIAEEKQLMNAADAISAEIRGAQNPDANLQTRLQQARQNLLEGRRAAAAAERQVEDLRQEAQQLRQTLQNEHAGLSTHRTDGAQLERTTQREINVLEVTMRTSDHLSTDSQSKLQKLQNDLRRIQAANLDLDVRMRDLLLEIRDVPLH